MDDKKKVLFYGAGEHAAMIYRHAARKSAEYGEPTAFIDRDIYKQGHDLFGLPVISWEDAQEKYGGNFYIYVTGNEQVAPEILGFLQEQGIPKERIINWEPVEKRLGCAFAETFLSLEPVGNTFRYFNCNRNAFNLNYENVQFKYIVDPSVAAHPDVVREGVEYVHRTAQKLSEGDQERLHPSCISKRVSYYYSERKVRSINFVGTAPCNFRCSYCLLNNPDFQPVTYKTYPVFCDILSELKEHGYLSKDPTVKLSNGEFTANQDGNRLVELASEYPVTLFTNGYIYSQAAADAIKSAGMLLTSVDAGTPETFHQVKGVNGFDRVANNLREYAGYGAVCLKYILLEGANDSWEDLDGFFRLADETALRVDLTRDFMDGSARFSNHSLEFAARFIQHFRDQGKLNMSLAAFVRSGEGERLNQMLEELERDKK